MNIEFMKIFILSKLTRLPTNDSFSDCLACQSDTFPIKRKLPEGLGLLVVSHASHGPSTVHAVELAGTLGASDNTWGCRDSRSLVLMKRRFRKAEWSWFFSGIKSESPKGFNKDVAKVE